MTGVSNIWNDTFLRLADLYKEEFMQSETEFYLKLLANSEIRIGVLCESYGVAVKLGYMSPIESITADEKWELYNEAKRLSENQDKDYLRSVCKVIYFLGQYIQI
jgi:hypothetical protein